MRQHGSGAVWGLAITVTVAATPWNARPAVSVRAQIDSARVEDKLGRRILAAHLEGLLGQLAAHSDSTNAVVHVDGPWGGGKSTLVKLPLHDEHTHGPSWTPPVVGDYEAWRDGAVAPEWWSLGAAIEREVRRSRPRVVRVVMQAWSVVARTLRSPATLVALAGMVAWLRRWTREQLGYVRSEATPEALRARGDHLPHTYADLVPPNPRMIKRVANALGVLLVVQMHVRHTEGLGAIVIGGALWRRRSPRAPGKRG
ncbi:KAP-like P-loop domain-containing protein [Actinokineospora auranticolor]|uniref:KAP-like P-loop domain-containing protein n=1 Tax=Actinokineospora auranticolor TaxID=155976 RepID=A0A2S6GLI5_9PSEU|nr:KAP-like P-loop domain-containing protein [Actinokineospora auranticolor]